VPVPLDQTSNFGIIEADDDGHILGFDEKPLHGKSIPSDTERAYASMGNYLFNTEVLVDVLEKAHQQAHMDFGHDVLPKMLETHRVFAYDFTENQVPGIKPYEEKGYWRDVGTVDAYFEANKDFLGLEPRFDAFNPQWPVFSSHYQGPVGEVFNSTIDNSFIGAAAVVNNALVRNSIIRREAVIEADVQLEECIIMDYVRVGQGSKLRKVIVDRHNIIEPNSRIGYNRHDDEARYHVTPCGVVVVQKGKPDYFARNSRGSGLGYLE
jgi:glucose-1-phosphate adenylyltransferase